jgi:5-methylcytosine-specific restriction protein A
MPSTDDFQAELDSIFAFATNKRLTAIVIKSGDLHRLVGDYPGTDHRMPICCAVMRKNMMSGDEILFEPPSGAGATLTIRYQFPRK